MDEVHDSVKKSKYLDIIEKTRSADHVFAEISQTHYGSRFGDYNYKHTFTVKGNPIILASTSRNSPCFKTVKKKKMLYVKGNSNSKCELLVPIKEWENIQAIVEVYNNHFKSSDKKESPSTESRYRYNETSDSVIIKIEDIILKWTEQISERRIAVQNANDIYNKAKEDLEYAESQLKIAQSYLSLVINEAESYKQ